MCREGVSLGRSPEGGMGEGLDSHSHDPVHEPHTLVVVLQTTRTGSGRPGRAASTSVGISPVPEGSKMGNSLVPTVLRPRNSMEIELDPERPSHFFSPRPLTCVNRATTYLRPYFLAQVMALRKYVHETFGRKGSPWYTSIAHHGKGIRTQFRPAAAMFAKSISVYRLVQMMIHRIRSAPRRTEKFPNSR